MVAGHQSERATTPLRMMTLNLYPLAATSVVAIRRLHVYRRRSQSLKSSATVVVGDPGRGYGIELVEPKQFSAPVL